MEYLQHLDIPHLRWCEMSLKATSVTISGSLEFNIFQSSCCGPKYQREITLTILLFHVLCCLSPVQFFRLSKKLNLVIKVPLSGPLISGKSDIGTVSRVCLACRYRNVVLLRYRCLVTDITVTRKAGDDFGHGSPTKIFFRSFVRGREMVLHFST